MAIFPAGFLFAAESKNNPLLTDNHFSRGVRITPPANIRVGSVPQNTNRIASVCLPQRDCVQQPAWQLQQWSNAQDIADSPRSAFTWTLQDRSGQVQKRLQLKPGDPVDGDVMLEINGLSEFLARSADGVPHYLPDLGKPWPHFLLSQQMDSGRLTQYDHLLLSGQMKLLFDMPQHREGYDPAVHAARLMLVITVRNRLTSDYFWLTLPLYDDRYPQSDFGCQKCTTDGAQCVTPRLIDDPAIDKNAVWRCPEDSVGEQWWQNEKTGTARMIFRMPTNAFVYGDARNGMWVQVSGDLLPYVQAGIEAVRQRENGMRFPRGLFFYELGLFSIGWEMTGFNHVAVQLRDWQLDARR
ncbi:MAG TPA: hypothetical protein VLB90_01660 [Pseudomonadales bacterium]|nr:hypothetical protein [Pseudomonadales bacterium]